MIPEVPWNWRHPACVYCGKVASAGSVACPDCADLPELDAQAPSAQREFVEWWLDRFTLDEIAALAAWL